MQREVYLRTPEHPVAQLKEGTLQQEEELLLKIFSLGLLLYGIETNSNCDPDSMGRHVTLRIKQL